MLSVLVAATLCIPFPFLYTNDYVNGSSNLPHHVWTSAQPYDGDVGTIPDVVMRTIWVHGTSYASPVGDTLTEGRKLHEGIGEGCAENCT